MNKIVWVATLFLICSCGHKHTGESQKQLSEDTAAMNRNTAPPTYADTVRNATNGLGKSNSEQAH